MSSLMQPGDFLAHEPTARLMRVVASGPCAFLAWQAQATVQNGLTVYLCSADIRSVGWEHITDFNEWLVVPTKPVLVNESRGPLGWVRSGDPQTLPCSLCLRGLKLTKSQLLQLISKLGGVATAAASKRRLQEILIGIALVSLDEQKQAMDQLGAVEQQDNDEIDSQLSEIISELDKEDGNQQELAEYKKKRQAQRWKRKLHSASADDDEPRDSALPCLPPSASSSANPAVASEDAVALSSDGVPAAAASSRKGFVKIHKSPDELLGKLQPPGFFFGLNSNDHRWTSSCKLDCSKRLPVPYSQRTMTRSFGPSTSTTWESALKQVHFWNWTKWEKLRQDLPLERGQQPQTPGDIPDDVLKELEKIVAELPEPKKYSRHK
ncbi:unnamed protein product [Symbiodinium sp. CCMP2456]|nr:unnamed protein product [Symbiodinium sp. CCMP2456]